jgi:penicillin-binding protein 1A
MGSSGHSFVDARSRQHSGQRIAALPWWRRWPTRREWLWFAAALPVLFVVYVLLLIPFTPSISDIRKAKLEQPAQILSADGKLIGEFKRSNRQWVPLEQISPAVVKALVATEDHRFYEHHGMDFTRTVGSVIHTLGGNPQGGSTITQQLARNLYPTEIGRARNVNRKLKEAITAFKIEALYTKDEILETYLNTVPFLYNAYGIEMAARTYFDKPAARLTVLESATLVGMLKGNAYYNPVINPDRAIARRNTVLSQMVKRGELKDDEFERLKKRPMRLDFERQEEPTGMAPHFSQQLRKWLIAWADKHDYNIYTDGLVVRTTLDSRLQNWAQQAVNRQMQTLQGIANNNWSHRDGWSAENALVLQLVRETEAFRKLARSGRPSDISEEEALKKLLADKAFMRQLREDKTRVQAGFLAIDPRTSAVLAWVGSRDYAQDAFDHVAQARRQPGSTFKPFVYGAALQRGARPDDTRKDEAVEIQLPGGEVWRPSDAVEPTGVPMKLSDALAYSKNTITAELGQEVGMDRVIKLARAGRAPEPAGARAFAGAGLQPRHAAGNGQRLRQHCQLRPLHSAPAGHPYRECRRRAAGRIHPAQARSGLGRGRELRSAGDDARRDRQGHGPRDSQAIRHSRRCGRQDRHHPGQCRRLVHPHAPADRGRCLGRLQRCAHHAQERPVGPGFAQRPAHGGRLHVARHAQPAAQCQGPVHRAQHQPLVERSGGPPARQGSGMERARR